MAAALLIAGAFLFIFLGHHANHEVRRFRSGDDLFHVEKQLGAGLVGCHLEALAIDPELAQPEHGVGDFLAVVGRHQNQPLSSSLFSIMTRLPSLSMASRSSRSRVSSKPSNSFWMISSSSPSPWVSACG